MAKEKVEHLIYDTYIEAIKNSIGSEIFRHYYIKAGGKKIDALRDGDLACAFYVSSLLRIFNLIEETHTFVINTEKDMLRHGWFHVKRPKIGAVIVWGAKTFLKSGESHKHIGFYIGHKKAISNNYKTGRIYMHLWNFGGSRSVESIFWHQSFKDK